MISQKRGTCSVQIHKKFTDEKVKELIEKYLRKEVSRSYLQAILGVNKTRFFALVKMYREDSLTFSIQYQRKATPRISKEAERNILKELSIEKSLNDRKDVPLRTYNYSYVKDRLEIDYKQKVSLTTIITKAKKNGFYLKRPKRSIHDREVLTNYAGELIQHDSSHHLWAPAAGEKWYLITSLDDFSRFIFYAQLIKKETSWSHILSLEKLFLHYGTPFSGSSGFFVQ
jgi:transposase